MSYFETTCRRMETHEIKSIANFEDDFGDPTCKEINGPSIFHFSCEFLPIIDEYNRMRQNIMGLERKWLETDC